MPYACFHQIWSKSVKKCAHSGQNKFSRRHSQRHDVVTSRKFQTPYYTRPGHIYDVSKFEEDRLRFEKQQRTLACKYGGGGSGRRRHQMTIHL